jgi:AMP-binding enzyme
VASAAGAIEEPAVIDPAGPENRAFGGADAGTLDEIFCRNARRNAQALALADPPDRESFTGGAPRCLSYAQADRAITALASRLQALALPADSIVALQMPNTVEAVVALLGIVRAGLVAAPLPLLWRTAESSAALGEIGARALICAGRVAGVDHGDIAVQIAAETFSIRFVLGFGGDPPDGVVPLDDIFAEAEAAPLRLPQRGGNPADHVAVVTFDTTPDRRAPVARSHTELLVGGLAAVLEARIARNGAILGTLMISSFAALATTVVPWLLTGGLLALHQPFNPSVLAEQCRRVGFDAVALPGPLVESLADAALLGDPLAVKAVLAVWRSPERQASSAAWNRDAALIDVLAFGEVGLLAMRRPADGAPARIVAGPVTAPYATPGAPVVMTVARGAAGTLTLSGPMVPQRALAPATQRRAAADGAAVVDTGYACRLEAETNALTLTGAPPGMVSVGGYRFALRELQDAVGRIDADGVLAALPDMLGGQKLAGTAADHAAMRAALDALGINPLVGAAFRDRRAKAKPAA